MFVHDSFIVYRMKKSLTKGDTEKMRRKQLPKDKRMQEKGEVKQMAIFILLLTIETKEKKTVKDIVISIGRYIFIF